MRSAIERSLAAAPETPLGESPAFLRVLEATSRIAPLDKPVLIVGERGTGKELIAERLHFLSARAGEVFLKMNCAAVTDSLLESELFGHEAGAFTGAARTHLGRFERASGGALFLDEIATTSPGVQEKLLRVIEYGEFERVGGSRTLTVNVRLIAATNQDLPRLADQGGFRHDLLDRLAFDVITLPPLRERGDDIELLAEHFAIRMCRELGRAVFPGFSPEARTLLCAHHWPGNVRELKNAVERSVYRSDPETEVGAEEVQLDPFASPWRPVPPTAGGSAGAMPKPGAPMDLKAVVRDLEINAIQAALAAARHNQRRAAELLSLTYHQLRGYLKKHDLAGRNNPG